MEEFERKIRHRSVGVIKFIAELFKLGILTYNIMFTCINLLLSVEYEETLECLCKLLTTVGSILETRESLEPFFKKINQLIEEYKLKNLSSRIKFMLMDVVDLRKNNWLKRGEGFDLLPKRIEPNDNCGRVIKSFSCPATPSQIYDIDNFNKIYKNTSKNNKKSKDNNQNNRNESKWQTPVSKKNRHIDLNKLNTKSLVRKINFN